jgi:hypothetical protein
MAAVSGLSPYVLLRDWLGMLESGLKMWPANLRAMTLEGQFIEDPPEIQAIFSQARERYLRVSEQRPAVYRQMQEAFSEAFALLLDSATCGLEQINGSPDVVGQVFITCLQPGHTSPWWRYFPDWPTALTAAQTALPEAHELVYLVLAEAGLTGSRRGSHYSAQSRGQLSGMVRKNLAVCGTTAYRAASGLLQCGTPRGRRPIPGLGAQGPLVEFSWDPAVGCNNFIRLDSSKRVGLSKILQPACRNRMDVTISSRDGYLCMSVHR